jgi:ribulose-5-phosphate 4-epimerase/fuculose-1-phosphate aldolase
MDKDLAGQVADVGCVLHTHSPYATAYAVLQRAMTFDGQGTVRA